MFFSLAYFLWWTKAEFCRAECPDLGAECSAWNLIRPSLLSFLKSRFHLVKRWLLFLYNFRFIFPKDVPQSVQFLKEPAIPIYSASRVTMMWTTQDISFCEIFPKLHKCIIVMSTGFIKTCTTFEQYYMQSWAILKKNMDIMWNTESDFYC